MPLQCHSMSLPWIFVLLFDSVVAFQSITSFLLNDHLYTEKVEQPWFRVHHHGHNKVPAETADDSSFGKHFIPEGDNFIKPYWTDIEQRTFHCFTRACVCSFFGGDNSSTPTQRADENTCRLPSGHSLPRAIRREIRMLSDEERHAVEVPPTQRGHRLPQDALNEMKRDGTYNRLSRVHKYSGVHSGPAFTVWHRELLKRFEFTIRKYQPPPHTLGMPYWDTSLDSLLPEPADSIMFTPAFLGTVDEEGHVMTGPYANWTTMEGLPYITRKLGADPEGEFLSRARIDWVASHTDINLVLAATLPLSTCDSHSMDDRFLEYSHDYVHFYISGDMGRSWSSSNDVIFLLHHSMIDHIFEMFRQNGQTRRQRERDYPETDERCFPPWHNAEAHMPFMAPIRNVDGLSNGYTDNLYQFDPRPTCDDKRRDCGSRYLHCDLSHWGAPTCMSKIRMGGNCEGFEGSGVCYEGQCVAGRCKPPVPGFKSKDRKPQKTKSHVQEKLYRGPLSM